MYVCLMFRITRPALIKSLCILSRFYGVIPGEYLHEVLLGFQSVRLTCTYEHVDSSEYSWEKIS